MGQGSPSSRSGPSPFGHPLASKGRRPGDLRRSRLTGTARTARARSQRAGRRGHGVARSYLRFGQMELFTQRGELPLLQAR